MGNCILTRRGGGAWVGIPNFTYTGTYETVDDGDGNWRIKFLTSGIFTLLKPKQLLIDVFCVGGGGEAAFVEVVGATPQHNVLSLLRKIFPIK